MYVTSPVLLPGLWIAKDILSTLTQDKYTDLGESTFIININKVISDEEVTFYGNLEAKIGQNLHLQIRRKGDESDDSDFEWCIMLHEKLQYYSFK